MTYLITMQRLCICKQKTPGLVEALWLLTTISLQMDIIILTFYNKTSLTHSLHERVCFDLLHMKAAWFSTAAAVSNVPTWNHNHSEAFSAAAPALTRPASRHSLLLASFMLLYVAGSASSLRGSHVHHTNYRKLQVLVASC